MAQRGLAVRTNFGVSLEYKGKAPFPNVRELLRHLSSEGGFPILSEIENGEGAVQVLLNGKDIWFYASKLDTAIRDGDVVEIYVMPLGGG